MESHCVNVRKVRDKGRVLTDSECIIIVQFVVSSCKIGTRKIITRVLCFYGKVGVITLRLCKKKWEAIK